MRQAYQSLKSCNDYFPNLLKRRLAQANSITLEANIKNIQVHSRDELHLCLGHEGDQRPAFLSVKDAMGMTIFLENIDAGIRSRETYGIYHLASENAHSWIYLVIPAFEAMGAPVNIEYIDLPEKV